MTMSAVLERAILSFWPSQRVNETSPHHDTPFCIRPSGQTVFIWNKFTLCTVPLVFVNGDCQVTWMYYVHRTAVQPKYTDWW